MKQWNFKMKKLCSKTLQTLINELNKPCSSWIKFVINFGIDLVVFFGLKFFIHGHECKRWYKVICVIKLKVIQQNDFQKLNKEKIAQRHLLKPNKKKTVQRDCLKRRTNRNFEVLLGQYKHYKHSWISCLCFFKFNHNLAIW